MSMNKRTVRGNPAAPAAASESDYLRLKDSLTFLTTEQLLSEGYPGVRSSTPSTWW